MNRYFVSEYTDGPAKRWNVIDRKSQEWVERFRTEQEANDWAAGMNHGKGGPTEKCPVEQEERKAKVDRCAYPPCREPDYCDWAAYCGATDFCAPAQRQGER